MRIFRNVLKRLLAIVGLQKSFKRTLYMLLRFRRPPRTLLSETSKCRDRLSKFCTGCGLDIGFGGDPILEHAIRIDLTQPYTGITGPPAQLAGDARCLKWFNTDTLDFVYSSHLLEDFEDTENILREWLRVLKPGGKLILFCPDEKVYKRYCDQTGHPYNEFHRQPDFSMEFVKNILGHIGNVRVIHEVALIDVYSWELVCEKKGT
jgi:predicted SAM-dependent methyltransferase